MLVKVIAFGIAKDILNNNTLNIEVPEHCKVGEARHFLEENYPEFKKLASLKFAVNETYQTDDYTLNPNDELIIIPPVSGG